MARFLIGTALALAALGATDKQTLRVRNPAPRNGIQFRQENSR